MLFRSEVAPARPRRGAVTDYAPGEIVLGRGEEMGRFNMGSTVIAVFAPGQVALTQDLTAGALVRVGQNLGQTT